MNQLSRFTKYAWGVLAYNLLVILWGVYVRASGSGAGCGSHWPLCNGEVIPQSPQVQTLIEFTHRMMSGLSLILVVGLVIWAFRAHPKGHPARLGASLSMFFIVTEALVGAGLVLFSWVAQNASIGRVISMSVHLVNTFFLLAALTLTAWWSSGGERLRLRRQGFALWGLGLGFLGVMLLGVTGSITALGDTLFPASSLAAGLQQDFSPASHFIIRLRVWHPLIAISVGLYLIFFSLLLAMFRPSPRTKRFTMLLSGLFVLQFAAGLINLVLLAPVWMQLLHLLLADSVWISLVLLAANTFAVSQTGYQLQDETSPLTSVVTAREMK
jgi:heme A synthase